jgi:error-prone DNA polymerase
MRISAALLHCLTNFSFLRGASHAEELVTQASKLGYTAIAITDECSVSGMVRAHVSAKECSIKLIVGAEFAVHDAPGIDRLLLYTQNRSGYGDLCELITLARSRTAKGKYRLMTADLARLPDCLAVLLPHVHHAAAADNIATISAQFPERCWLGAAHRYSADEEGALARLMDLAEQFTLPVAACDPVLFALREDKPMQDVLTAVRLKKPVAELGTELLAHAEHYLKPIPKLLRRYSTEMLTETLLIAARCTFSLDELRYEYPREVVAEGETPASYLRKLTYEGADRRYPQGISAHVRALVEKELTLISELQYEAYFLTIHDVVKFARDQRILCQGRGSAANSAVCYCLGITEVDPSRMQVLFERFISKERNEPPDIDVDFEHERREEVMQYIYNKYGRDRTALTAAVSTYRPKGAIRDVGKALGLTLSQVDALSKAIVWWDGRNIAADRLREAGFDPDNTHMRTLLALTHALVGFPRHLSQHSGGFVIARDKLTRLVPVENAAMENRTVIQWDKDDLDELGLLKVDILALGMLTAIRKTLDVLGRWQGRDIALQDVPSEDAATYRMIQKADTVGVFQIESRAQMSMLPRLKPKCFYDLVIEVAIVRPGPIQGGMVHPYLKRRNGQEPVNYPSDAVKKVLERTLGVSIFQEQVMQLAVVAAGFTPGEADRLRRAMAAWKRKGGLEPFRDKLINGMLERGYLPEFAEAIYRQMQGFGEYGFPESHAASFALLVYVSCWLKCHHPAAFTCGLLNAQPLGFYSPSQLVQDVRRHDVTALPVDVTVSDWDCTLEGPHEKPGIRLGLRMIAGLKEADGRRVVASRTMHHFDDVADLQRRAELSDADVTALAAADALVPLTGHRREALWEALGLERDTRLFMAPADPDAATLIPPTEADDIFADFRTTGLTLRRHPMALLRPELKKIRISSADEVRNARHGQLIRASGLVTCRQRPATAKGTTFVTLEDETGYVNVVVWSHVADRQRKELVFSKLLCVAGRVERQGEVVHLIAGRLIDQTAMLSELDFSSRDFH